MSHENDSRDLTYDVARRENISHVCQFTSLHVDGFLHARNIGIAQIGLIEILAKIPETAVGEEIEVELEEKALFVCWLVGIIPNIALDCSQEATCRAPKARFLPRLQWRFDIGILVQSRGRKAVGWGRIRRRDIRLQTFLSDFGHDENLFHSGAKLKLPSSRGTFCQEIRLVFRYVLLPKTSPSLDHWYHSDLWI